MTDLHVPQPLLPLGGCRVTSFCALCAESFGSAGGHAFSAPGDPRGGTFRQLLPAASPENKEGPQRVGALGPSSPGGEGGLMKGDNVYRRQFF